MNKTQLDPIKFIFELSDLPANYRNLSDENLYDAVSSFFSEYFKGIGGEVKIEIINNQVVVKWLPYSLEDTENAIEEAINLLQKGQHAQGEVILAELFKKYPENPIILFNYGMLLSDKKQLNEAIKMLDRLVEICPDHAQAWNALGIAHFRSGDRSEALYKLKKSYELNPDDPYTLRNLGGLLADESEEKAFPYIQKAAQLLPEDPQAQYGYGLSLMKLKEYDEADMAFRKVIALAPYTEIEELAKEARTKIASVKMRSASDFQPRMDVVMYCLAALEKYEALGPEKKQAITFEIAMLGRGGLDINNPEPKYTLKSLPGKFSGMQLVTYMFVGMKQIEPNLDPGIDLEEEYKAALTLFGKKPNPNE